MNGIARKVAAAASGIAVVALGTPAVAHAGNGTDASSVSRATSAETVSVVRALKLHKSMLDEQVQRNASAASQKVTTMHFTGRHSGSSVSYAATYAPATHTFVHTVVRTEGHPSQRVVQSRVVCPSLGSACWWRFMGGGWNKVQVHVATDEPNFDTRNIAQAEWIVDGVMARVISKSGISSVFVLSSQSMSVETEHASHEGRNAVAVIEWKVVPRPNAKVPPKSKRERVAPTFFHFSI